MTQRRRRNIAKLLARLNPKGMALKPSPGSGSSLPPETALDIAGALGAVGQGGAGPHLAVLVLCLRWWPGMFEGPMRTIGHRRIHNQPRLHDKLKDKRRELLLGGCCQDLPIEAPAESQAMRVVVSLLAGRMGRKAGAHLRAIQMAEENARASLSLIEPASKRWAAALAAHADLERDLRLLSRATERYFLEDWARVVVQEYRHPNHCQACTPWGRAGEVPRTVEEGGKVVRVEWRTCEVCAGAGVMAWSGKRRAKAMHVGEHPWRNFLNPIHDGALSLLRELESRGARRLVNRLGE